MIVALIASAVVSMSAPAPSSVAAAPSEAVSVSAAPELPAAPKRRRGRPEYPYRADADYFNDFERIVRSDDIDSVIDNHRLRDGRSCLTSEQERSRADVLSVLDVLYSAPDASRPALIRLASIVSSLEPGQLGLLVHVLRGGTFTDYALCEGVTKAAVGQRWKTIVGRCPLLAEVKGAGNGPRQILGGRVREGARKS